MGEVRAMDPREHRRDDDESESPHSVSDPDIRTTDEELPDIM